MRGRTLNNAFIILDEAQNSTTEQMFMFLTRLGISSKAVITGDETQIDLPMHKQSGLLEAHRALKHVDGIAIVEFSKRDSSAIRWCSALSPPTKPFVGRRGRLRRRRSNSRQPAPSYMAL